jgi:predicted Fe-S protein YdhL (DUF1289 family)
MATALATHRQSVTQTLCTACRRQAKEEAAAVWTSLTPQEQRAVRKRDLVTPCPYTEQSARLEDPEVRLMIGTRQSFQHGGSRLADVDLVVVDEAADALFLQAFDLGMGAVAVWEHRQRHDEALWQDLAPVLSVLKRALVTGPADGVIDSTRETPLLPVLRALDPQFDDHLRALAAQVRGRPPWERGFAIDVPTEAEVWEGKEPLPTRALVELVQTLAWEAQPGVVLRDTRVWLCPQSGQTPGQLWCWVGRDDLVESLRARTTVFLDATAHVPTVQRIFGGQVQVHAWPLKPYTHVTFLGDALYRPQDLARAAWRKPALFHAVTRLCQQQTAPLVVCPMGLEEELRQHLPAHAVLTHWYAGDMAGANTYEHCDAIILIGHPRPPESVVVQQVQALRWAETLEQQAHATDHPDGWATVEWAAPVEGFIDGDGGMWARLVTYAQDPEIRDLARHRYSAAPIQAIGRLRPANPRPAPLP